MNCRNFILLREKKPYTKSMYEYYRFHLCKMSESTKSFYGDSKHFRDGLGPGRSAAGY